MWGWGPAPSRAAAPPAREHTQVGARPGGSTFPHGSLGLRPLIRCCPCMWPRPVASAHPFLLSTAAANNTWWNIYASSRPTASLAIPDCGYGPLLNYVGGFGPPAKGAAGIAGPGSPAGTPTPLFPAYCTPGVAWWVEQKRAGAALSPPDLFPAMVATRQQRLAIPAVRRPKN